jgi:hypothetical protein
MFGMKSLLVVIVVVITLLSAACSAGSVSSGSAKVLTPPAPTSPKLATDAASAPAATSQPTPAPTPGVAFRALETPAGYSSSSADAVDGTTAVGWVQVGIADEEPAVWDTTTGALRVLDVPAEFVHPNGDTFVRLVGISGKTAVGTGILGKQGQRGQDRAMAWNTKTGDLRILDIPSGFTEAEAHAISGTTAVGQVLTAHRDAGRPVAWDTESGAVRILTMPAGYDCVKPQAISGDTVVGSRCDGDFGLPMVWNPLTADARDLDLVPATQDGLPRAVDGTTAVGDCCYGEEGTTLPLIWDTGTGSVRQLALPAPFEYGRADGVSGTVVVGSAGSTQLVWDLATGQSRVLLAPEGHDSSMAVRAVSGRTIVGSACELPASASDNVRCVAAAWTLQ